MDFFFDDDGDYHDDDDGDNDGNWDKPIFLWAIKNDYYKLNMKGHCYANNKNKSSNQMDIRLLSAKANEVV